MKSLFVAVFLSLFGMNAVAAGVSVPLDHFDADIRDQESMQRGVALFTNYCMGCHGLSYSRYERVAGDLGIPHELYEQNLILDGSKIGQLMKTSMDPDLAASWFGAPPPDLSLVARLRGTDWLYSYMRAFYKDDSRPWGVNNAVFKDVGMPHVLADLQGLCAEEPAIGTVAEVDPISGEVFNKPGCRQYETEGSMSPAEYDQAMKDLVNFLAYVGEPSRLQAESIAPWVLLFLAILFIPAYFLNREYWKDVH